MKCGFESVPQRLPTGVQLGGVFTVRLRNSIDLGFRHCVQLGMSTSFHQFRELTYWCEQHKCPEKHSSPSTTRTSPPAATVGVAVAGKKTPLASKGKTKNFTCSKSKTPQQTRVKTTHKQHKRPEWLKDTKGTFTLCFHLWWKTRLFLPPLLFFSGPHQKLTLGSANAPPTALCALSRGIQLAVHYLIVVRLSIGPRFSYLPQGPGLATGARMAKVDRLLHFDVLVEHSISLFSLDALVEGWADGVPVLVHKRRPAWYR